MAQGDALDAMQGKIWAARLPLEIRAAAAECRTYDKVDPYLIAVPRLSYLPSLLPRLLSYFAPYLIADPESISSNTASFTYESVFLKWYFPIGLLYDLHILSTQSAHSDDAGLPSEPFRLTVHFSGSLGSPNADHIPMSEQAMNDAFINAVKEADFLRSGTAKPIMSLSAADSKALWSSAQDNELRTFAKIHNGLLPPPNQLRNIPFRVYIPSGDDEDPTKGRIKILQGQFPSAFVPLIAPTASQPRGGGSVRTQTQTIGTALHTLVPSLFPSRRTPLIARPILHGAPVPMSANLEDLCRKCCYADGWVNIVVAMTA